MASSLNDWPFPKSLSVRWRLGQLPLLTLSHTITKLYLRLFQQVQTKNLGVLHEAVAKRPSGTPLVTVSNHTSCLDDPVIWGTLPVRTAFTENGFRWTPAAKELLFTNKVFTSFFSRGQVVPVIRGDGVYQKAVNFCIQLLNDGKWIHVFPEGKVNANGDFIRLKWGVGRMIAEARIPPIVLPLYHIGMEDILPEIRPYIPRLFKRLTLLVGEPIDFTAFLNARKTAHTSAVVLRKQITDLLQEKMSEMKAQAEVLHQNWTGHWPVSYRTL